MEFFNMSSQFRQILNKISETKALSEGNNSKISSMASNRAKNNAKNFTKNLSASQKLQHASKTMASANQASLNEHESFVDFFNNNFDAETFTDGSSSDNSQHLFDQFVMRNFSHLIKDLHNYQPFSDEMKQAADEVIKEITDEILSEKGVRDIFDPNNMLPLRQLMDRIESYVSNSIDNILDSTEKGQQMEKGPAIFEFQTEEALDLVHQLVQEHNLNVEIVENAAMTRDPEIEDVISSVLRENGLGYSLYFAPLVEKAKKGEIPPQLRKHVKGKKGKDEDEGKSNKGKDEDEKKSKKKVNESYEGGSALNEDVERMKQLVNFRKPKWRTEPPKVELNERPNIQSKRRILR